MGLVASGFDVCSLFLDGVVDGPDANTGLAVRFDNFDEFTRRQYNAKAPQKENPFGYEEQPKKFLEFDVFLKLRVLHQLSVWTFWNPDRIRAKMPEQREIDQTGWVSATLDQSHVRPGCIIDSV